MKKWIFTAATALIGFNLFSQVVSVDPPFPTINDEVTITFDATQGNGDLTNIIPVYAHTGVIFDGALSEWQNVQPPGPNAFNTPNEDVLMTVVGPNLHQITYNIIDFYGLNGDENVTHLSFVFRNGNGSIVGRAADGSDIYVPVFPEGDFAAAITSPASDQIIIDPVTDFDFQAEASQSADISLYVNDDEVASETNAQSVATSVDLTALSTGQNWFWMEADNGTTVQTDSVSIIIQPDAQVLPSPAGVIDGINYIDDNTVVLQLHAPNKDFVYLLGDFNNWQFQTDFLMNVTPEGDRYWIQLDDLVPGQEYRFQYSIDQEDLRIADIYCEKVLDPWNDPFIPESVYPGLIDYPEGLTTEVVGVFQTAQEEYNWVVEDFQRPPADQLVIYELLVRDFLEDHSYQSLIDTLSYFERLEVNAIQLMPIMEFEGNISWGYNPMFYFAPDKYYGTEEKLKEFIDECHQRGIAVILDAVFNHSFGQNPQVRMYSENGAAGPVTPENPWFNVVPTHDFNVGYDYNHDNPDVQAFVERNLRYWIQEYKFDGFRFDLSKGFTQNNTLGDIGAWNAFDQSRVNHWMRIRDEIQAYDEDAYLILEHLGGNDEESFLANEGFMLWGKMTDQYNQNSMGYASNANLAQADYQVRGWSQPGLVSYAESHDEERLMVKNLEFGNSSGDYDVTDLETALSRQEAVAAFLYPHRGPKMLWQFGELGYDFSINYCPDGSINPDCRTAPKPIVWEYQDEPARERLYKVTAALIKLKTENEAFRSDNYTWDVGGLGKRLIIQDSQMDVVIIANFEVEPINMVPGFTQTGTWYDYFTGGEITVSDLNNGFLLEPGEYRVYTTEELETPDITVGVYDEEFSGGALDAPYPNPFYDFTQLSFNLKENSQAELLVMDMQGRVVRTLASGNFASGNHMQRWNGRDESGAKVASGLYLIQLRTDKGVATTTVMVGSKR